MINQAVQKHFFDSAAAWICDGYSLDVRYLAARDDLGTHLLDALIVAVPVLTPSNDQEFEVDVGTLVAGRIFYRSTSKAHIAELLSDAVNGKVASKSDVFELDSHRPFDFYSEPHNRETWIAHIHLQVLGSPLPLNQSSIADSAKTDQLLRAGPLPFDGVDDLCSWLNLSDTRPNGRQCGINIRVLPPVDIFIDQGKLEANRLCVHFDAHANLDPEAVGFAAREFPGRGITTRAQFARHIQWQPARDGRRQGLLDVNLENADSVLTMLSANGLTIRRHWFIDQEKSVNPRYVATQLFDRELKQLRQSVFPETSDTNKNDAARFEKGISSLLFMLGFAVGIQVETDAPDLILSSPSGKLSLIECTLRPTDFRAKLEKLVARRTALTSRLESTGHNVGVIAILVCGAPRAQLNVDEKHLIQSKVLLLCREDIEKAFYRIRNPVDPEELLRDAVSKLDHPLRLIS